MINDAVFQSGINRIATATRQVADAATQGVYLDVFTPLMDTAEWERFARWAAAHTPWVADPKFRTFPSVPELLEALRKFRGERPILAEATEAYEAVLAAGNYTAQAGTSWTYRGVLEKCGRGAAEAFLAAGGSSAFAQTWDEAQRRERFVAGYAEAVREDPGAKLLPAPARRALPPAAGEGDALPTAEQAKQIVERVRELVGEAPTVKPAEHCVIATDERLAELERQKRAILADATPPETVAPERAGGE